MNAPTLLVGLGGTGSKIVLKVSKMVTEEERKRIQFAVFDTDINELRDIREGNPFVKTIQTSTKLSVGEYLNIDTHSRDSWFPVNQILNSKTLTEGAGQVRAISRLAFETAVRAGNLEPLHQAVDGLYKLEEEKSEQALRVIIVSSLAGGTGSGLILPVALYLQNYLKTRYQQSANITRGFFILPEVFYEVIRGQAERNNLRCNAYATLRELDAFLMKGDHTLPEKYENSVKMEFPRVGSSEFEEYPVRPYDFCFLFDAQNTDGHKLNNFNQYLDHAANCIYAQSIGPMNKRSNSSEDNTIRELCAQSGRNRYAGAGTSMLIYPVEDVKKYIASSWTKECVSSQWLVFDEAYKNKQIENNERRNEGVMVRELPQSEDYISQVEAMAKSGDGFAKALVNQCSVFDESGFIREDESYNVYVSNLQKYVKGNAASDLKGLASQKENIMAQLGDIDEGKDAYGELGNLFTELEKYHGMSEKRSEEAADSIAYSIFHPTSKLAVENLAPHQLEKYLISDGSFIHPNAVRYFLYKTEQLMKDEKRRLDKAKEEDLTWFEDFMNIFDDSKTEDYVETAADLVNRKRKFKLGKGLDRTQEEIKQQYVQYVSQCDDYREHIILSAVLDKGITYVSNLSKAFELFYASFDARITGINRDINVIAKKYNHSNGRTARYVCASKECLDKMLKEMPYIGSVSSIDGELSMKIYSSVRDFSMMKDKPEASRYFEGIFNKDIVGYFTGSLMDRYGSNIDLDIVEALEKEAYYEKGEIDSGKVEQYVSHVIQETRALSLPFIERPLGEQKEPIPACTYAKTLDPRDDSPKSALIQKELANFGAVPDEDIPKNKILFYQSIYGLRANGLSKFSPGKEDGTGQGEYFKAYYELVNQIMPKTNKTPVITPHIDKNWHIVTAMPDLDEKNQIAQEDRIYKAFMLGLLNRYVVYSPLARGKFLYKLKIKGLNSDEFVVSNKTPCDLFYEVLDALTINPTIVTAILKEAERNEVKELNSPKKVSFENSKLKDNLDRLELKEYAKSDLSLFDLCTLLKVSTPNSEFEESQGRRLLKVMLDTVYEYMEKVTAPNDLLDVFGAFVVEQVTKFYANMNWYFENYHDNFTGYVDDLVRVADEMLDDLDLLDYIDKVHDVVDNYEF